MFEEINAHLAERGYRVRAGTIVDASIIAAPSSTKNREGARDPEMHQTRKGNEWHFGMKAHIGVDAETGLVHGVRATPANTVVGLVSELILEITDPGIRTGDRRCLHLLELLAQACLGSRVTTLLPPA